MSFLSYLVFFLDFLIDYYFSEVLLIPAIFPAFRSGDWLFLELLRANSVGAREGLLNDVSSLRLEICPATIILNK